MAKLQFHGAAQTVTGSNHLLHHQDGITMLDCGLYQGRRSEARDKNKKFPVRPQLVQSVLLSHAHIDHSGNIPGLVRGGFKGNVYATKPTCDLCDIMLADSAHIQEEDARFWNERRAAGPEEYIEPLYTAEDAKKASRLFTDPAYDQPINFADGCTAKFIEAGHILGSACVYIEVNQSKPIKILFTGDLGRFHLPILRDPSCPLPDVDYLITESTYANRRHDNPTDMKGKLAKIINETREVGGKVIIPAFSVGRTQTVTYFLSLAMAEGLMEPLPIFVDSPLSVNATEVFKKHPECYDREARDFWFSEGDIFGRGNIRYITAVDESKALNGMDEPCVIIASAGMCEAGRILHHLKNNVEDEKNTVVVVGYMAKNTLGRRIVERREEIKIFGRLYKMMCRLETLNGFSAHADRDDFMRCLAPLAKNLKGAFVVHGENDQLTGMQDILTQAGCDKVFIPSPGEQFDL